MSDGNTGMQTTVKTCECGCGQPAPIATYTNRKMGYRRGEPIRFIHGHFANTLKKSRPLTYCECGCGQLVRNRYQLGHAIRRGYMARVRRERDIEPRFWRNVKKSEGCWEWTGARSGNGYGAISWHNKQHGAHRVSWMLANGREIPAGMQVLHACDNPLCVRPEHLSLGSLQENSLDMVRKNRASRVGPGNPAKGERNARAVLNEIQVREIRGKIKSGMQYRTLGREYGVSETTIRFIAIGKTWKYLED